MSIHCHNYMPNELKFKSLNKEDNLYMGFELEIEREIDNTDDDEYEILKRKAIDLQKFLNKETKENLFYFKEDGSLNYGFEIVSHPMTYKYIKKK